VVNSPHDVGAMQQFGPVPRETDEPVFHADWERKIFAIMLGLAGQGRYNADHFRSARETIAPHRYLTSRYYELWLHAVERLLAGTIEGEEIDAKVAELRRDPSAAAPTVVDAALAETLHRGLREGHSTRGAVDRPRRFTIGDGVHTRNEHPAGHTRLPRYARDKYGVVEALYPAFPMPDRADAGDYGAEYVYCVRFAGEELWGDTAEPGCEVHLDMWEPYLFPAEPDAVGAPRTEAQLGH
jgi:nitrile hydratase